MKKSRTFKTEEFIAWGKAAVRARMKKVTATRRREIARNAALARWKKRKSK